LTEPDFPYEKKPNESFNDLIAPSHQMALLTPQISSLRFIQLVIQRQTRLLAKYVEVFKTKEELTMHLETEHQTPQEENVKLKTP
jgi:hypothetical protein